MEIQGTDEFAARAARLDDSGDAVAELQKALLASGLSRLPDIGVDGGFGPITDIYVRALQIAIRDVDSSVKIDGIAGPAVWARLDGGAVPAAANVSAAVVSDGWPRLSSAAEVDGVFRARFGAGFVEWFRQRHSGQGQWSGLRLVSGPDVERRVRDLFDHLSAVFGRGPLPLPVFLTVFAIAMVETGGLIAPVSERVGLDGHPGIAYAFDRIDTLGKASYNGAANHSVFDVMNRSSFTDAHGHLPLGDRLVNTSDEVWRGERFPQDRFPTTVDPGVSGILLEADFYKFRGRGLIQTTWRANYRPLIEHVQGYNGSHPLLAEYSARWRGIDVDVVADQSTNRDWDRLYQESDGELALVAIRMHENSHGNYLDLAADDDNRLFGQDTGSIWNAGKRVNGRSSYANVLRDRVRQLLDDVRSGTAAVAGGSRVNAANLVASPRPELKLDVQGRRDAVIDLQKLLASTVERVLPALAADGKFGARTDLWVRVFQQRANLGVDGKVGAGTWKVLKPR
ncbi:MAG: peptidoglycan-binding protein [Acidimicrobiia bacterium]